MCIEQRLIEALENLLIDGGSIGLSDDGLMVWSGNVAAREAAQIAAYEAIIEARNAPRAALIETIPSEAEHA